MSKHNGKHLIQAPALVAWSELSPAARTALAALPSPPSLDVVASGAKVFKADGSGWWNQPAASVKDVVVERIELHRNRINQQLDAAVAVAQRLDGFSPAERQHILEMAN
jgi:hypothetical protein